MIDLEEQLTLEEEACLDRIEHHLHEMKMECLAFKECIQSISAKIFEILEIQNKILGAKIKEIPISSSSVNLRRELGEPSKS